MFFRLLIILVLCLLKNNCLAEQQFLSLILEFPINEDNEYRVNDEIGIGGNVLFSGVSNDEIQETDETDYSKNTFDTRQEPKNYVKSFSLFVNDKKITNIKEVTTFSNMSPQIEFTWKPTKAGKHSVYLIADLKDGDSLKSQTINLNIQKSIGIPNIDIKPLRADLSFGQNVKFKITNTKPEYTYQWEQSIGDSQLSWVPIESATGSDYETPRIRRKMKISYRCIISNSLGSRESDYLDVEWHKNPGHNN